MLFYSFQKKIWFNEHSFLFTFQKIFADLFCIWSQIPIYAWSFSEQRINTEGAFVQFADWVTLNWQKLHVLFYSFQKKIWFNEYSSLFTFQKFFADLFCIWSHIPIYAWSSSEQRINTEGAFVQFADSSTLDWQKQWNFGVLKL